MEIKEGKDLLKDVRVEASQKETDALLKAFAEDKPVADKIRSLKLSRAQVKENIGLVAAYKDDVDYCAHCPGLAACHKETPFYQSDLILKDGLLSRTYGPCELYMHEQTILGAYVYRDFPDEWLDLTPAILSNSERVIKVLISFNKANGNKQTPWVYMTGEIGSGRSYLAAAFSNGCALQGEHVAFMNANKRFDELKGLAVENKKAFDARMQELQAVPLLVIDDFGSEYKSDYVRDQIVMPLLTERAKRNLMTVFLSDYQPEEIEALYATTRSGAIMAKKLVGLIQSKISGVTVVQKGVETL
jgi:primosomal protein DnaI